MKIGLMSDTHDNLEATEEAVKIFNDEKVDQVLHAGDLVSPFVVSKLSDLKADLHFVWGNNEGDRLHIIEKFEEIGIEPAGELAVIELKERKIALIHGTDERVVEALAKSEEYDVVVRGHTHGAQIKKEPFVINPGATSGYLAGEKTIAILDIDDLEAEILEI